MPRLRARSRHALLSVLAAVLVALVPLAVTVSNPAQAAPTKGSLVIVSVNDTATGLPGAVQGRSMSVVVEARDPNGLPLAVNQATKISLTAGGPGTLGGTTTGTIAKNTSQVTITGAVYSGGVSNSVQLTATVTGGVALTDDNETIRIVSTAVKANASPRSALNVTDPACPAPTTANPVCGFLQLPNGANGTIFLYVGSCDGVVACFANQPQQPAGLVTAEVSLKDENGESLYKTSPATFILACDKTLCSNGGVPSFRPLVDLTNAGPLVSLDDCPAKGVLGADQDACLDTVQSKRDGAGDLYSVILFDHDIRSSYP